MQTTILTDEKYVDFLEQHQQQVKTITEALVTVRSKYPDIADFIDQVKVEVVVGVDYLSKFKLTKKGIVWNIHCSFAYRSDLVSALAHEIYLALEN